MDGNSVDSHRSHCQDDACCYLGRQEADLHRDISIYAFTGAIRTALARQSCVGAACVGAIAQQAKVMG